MKQYYVPFTNATAEDIYNDTAADAADSFLATAEGAVSTLVQRFNTVNVFVSYPNELKGGVRYFGDTFITIEDFAKRIN